VKPLTCTATRRRLHAFHDNELGVSDQINVASHLEWCDDCAAALRDFQTIRHTLVAFAPRSEALSYEESAAFNSAVINRLKAEHDVSFFVRARAMFDDMHLVYAGLGAALATVFCVMVTLSMMRFATKERPDSLAAIVSMLATPLECEFGNELADPSLCRERWVERFQRANEAAEQDAVFSLEEVLTKDGHLAGLSASRRGERRTAPGQVKVIEGLLDAVTRSRLESGQSPQPPASASLLWLVARETVRATKPAIDVPLPPKKRAASFDPPIRTTRA
jgi:putative zinc finger protein